MKITYSAVVKNPSRKTAPWYGRVREPGKKERFIPLNTQDRAEAMKWVQRQENILFQINEYLDAGKPVPDDLMAKLITVDTTPTVIKDSKRPFTEPGATLDHWEVAMRAAGMRETTIANYQRCFIMLLHGRTPEELTPDSVKEIILSSVNLKNATRRFYCNALSSLFRWMDRQDLVKALPKVKVEGSNPVYWTEEQMFDIIAELRSDTPERTLQYRQYYDLQRLTGCRTGEAYLLEWRDLDYESQSILFRSQITKSRKSRQVPVPFRLFAELENRRGEPNERIFNLVSTSQSRRYTVLKKALNRLGLTGSAHSFRRSRAMILYKTKGADIKAIAQLLGHSPSVSLEFYQQSRGLEDLRDLVEEP